MSAEPMQTPIARRRALARGAKAVAAIAVLWTWRAGAQARKLDRAAVQYVDAGTSPGKDCDDCLHFVPGPTASANGTCRIVEGPINPHGHCLAFTAKPRR
jgi:hypothetical protein